MSFLSNDETLGEPNALHTHILNKLPPEIRQSIYQQYYSDCSERVIYFTHNGRHGRCVVRVAAETDQNRSPGQPVFDLVKPEQNLLHLPLTCRQIYSECMPALYSYVPFRFLSADALVALSSKVPSRYLEHVTTLTLEAPGYSLLEDYFDKIQWNRVWHIISKLGRLRRLTVNMLDSERSLARQDWTAVLGPMADVNRIVDFDVKLHCEPDVLPTVGIAAPFHLSWLDEDGTWHPIDNSV